MAVWLVRAGKNGERESFALENNQAVIGWNELPDLSNLKSKEKLSEIMQECYPDANKFRVANYVGQVWSFVRRIERDDYVILPLKTRSAIAIGKVKSNYKYRPKNPEDARHSRDVEWIRVDIPRASFKQDILYSFGAFMTVCRIERNNAEERIKAVLDGKPDTKVPLTPDEGAEQFEAPHDIEEFAGDQIREHIGRKFKGHDLAQLVAQVLKAQGYQVEVSSPGPDGGVDILAGLGAMAFESPRLCVQVKSGSTPIDVNVFRELQGVMQHH